MLDGVLTKHGDWLEATHKVDTNSRDVRLGIGVIGESQQQTRLSNTGISDEEELEEVIVSGGFVSEKSSYSRIPILGVNGERKTGSRR